MEEKKNEKPARNIEIIHWIAYLIDRKIVRGTLAR